MKLCPLLVKEGFLEKNGRMRRDKNWIERVCCYCPLEKTKGYCIYDFPRAISAEEIKLLLGDNGNESSDT